MAADTTDLFFHPVRLRVIQLMLGGQPWTTSQLAAALADVPQATLYRHVAILAEADVLNTVDERRVRGSVERTYVLGEGVGTLGADELRAMPPESHRRAFSAFVAGLLDQFDRYTQAPNIDLERDGVSYRQTALWLTDAELFDLAGEIHASISRRARNTEQGGRSRRLLTQIVLPG